MYGVNNVNHSPFAYGKKGQPPVQPDQKPVDGQNTGRKDEILFSSVSRKDESYLSSLSKEAKDYLAKLKEMCPDYDFIVADFETDEDADRLLSQGKGSVNVLISPDMLEKMATDEATRNKYEEIIKGAKFQFDKIRENLTEDAQKMVKSLNITIGKDGEYNWVARLIDGITGEDGSSSVKTPDVQLFVDMLNNLAAKNSSLLDKKKDDGKPPQAGKQEKTESKLPPKSYEKFRKEGKPFSKEKDYGTLPPKSFEKYKKEENFYDRKKEPGNLPPESFEKYRKEQPAHEAKDDHGDHHSKHEDMNYKV